MPDLLPGTEVTARGLRWELVNTQNLGGQILHRLRGIEGAFAGQELDLLGPFDEITPVTRALRPEKPASLPNWLAFHQAFLLEQAFGMDALSAVQPGRLRIEPYQLVPVLRALRLSRVRLLLADGVGLGKTIQAGLLLTELIARRIAHRILIVSPSGPLLAQWGMEMSHRFGLRFQVIDRQSLDEVRRSTELGAIPFDHISLGLASIDFLKQEKVLEDLERSSYDVVIIDEAHHCMEVGGDDRDASLRRRLAEVLARRSDALILATATPHDGNDRSFASICELLDPSLVDGRGALRGDRYRQHVVRRLKKHILTESGAPRFKERDVEPCPVRARSGTHDRFIELHQQLIALIAPELRKALRSRRYSDVLSFISLLKRSVSTVAACKATLEAVRDRFRSIQTETAETQESRKQRLRSLRELNRTLERFGTVSLDQEAEQQTLEVEDLAQQLFALEREVGSEARHLRRYANMADALDALIRIAESATGQDPKLAAVIAQVQSIRAPEPRANVLIYTEYTDSQAALVAALQQAGVGPVITMSGEDDEKARATATDRFRNEDNLILVSTDAAAEGLNLHQRCHHLLHLELPFNPNRLEQRNGRIDRFGQEQTPMVRYLFLCGTFEQRILLRLIAKYERQRKLLTFVPNTLGVTASAEATAERLLTGLVEQEASLFQREEPVFDLVSGQENSGADSATRELLEEIDRSLQGFERAATANTWLGAEGLNAEASLFKEADQARQRGAHLNSVDLARFVRDAVLLEGGDVRDISPDITEMTLPPAWMPGLKDTPGIDVDTRTVRLTTKLEIIQDSQKRDVGFLGRAHPLVRRALDRVRHLALGGTATSVDQRISAVVGDLPQPALLFTFLGRLLSRAGREFEQVLAILVRPPASAEFIADSGQWLRLADPANAMNTRDVWQNHFVNWAQDAEATAIAAARRHFHPIAADVLNRRRTELRRDRERLHEWLEFREREIIADRGQSAVQQELLASARSQSPQPQLADWARLTVPLDRLSGFAGDNAQPVALRHEAQTVLSLFKKRRDDFDARDAMRDPEITTLGMLMIVPRNKQMEKGAS
ncbi:MAG: helicase-related protein [Verrucomicrobiota bacterium]